MRSISTEYRKDISKGNKYEVDANAKADRIETKQNSLRPKNVDLPNPLYPGLSTAGNFTYRLEAFKYKDVILDDMIKNYRL